MISIKSRAEEKSARLQSRQDRATEEREEAQSKKAEKIARLRSLRLAREATGINDSDGDANEREAGEKKPPQLPQSHRR